MSLNAIHRSVMIFSNSQEKAENKLNELSKTLGEEIVMRKKDFIKTPTKTIQARWFGESCRGYRYQEVYIDNELKYVEDAVNSILVKLVPAHYYIGVEKNENYNWREHVHYFN